MEVDKAEPLPLDLNHLSGEVLKRTGIAVPANDICWAFVVMNEIILERVASESQKQFADALATRLEGVRRTAVKWAAEQMIEEAEAARHHIQRDLERADYRADKILKRVESGYAVEKLYWMMGGFVLSILLLFIGVSIGKFFL